MDEDRAVIGCAALALGFFVTAAWAFGAAWHFWGPR
jgi:hypothetical protein